MIFHVLPYDIGSPQDHTQSGCFIRRTHKTQKLLFWWLWFITIKGYRSKQEREKPNGAKYRKTRNKLPGDPPKWSHTCMCLILLIIYDSLCEVLPTCEAHISLDIQSFYWWDHSHRQKSLHDWLSYRSLS